MEVGLYAQSTGTKISVYQLTHRGVVSKEKGVLHLPPMSSREGILLASISRLETRAISAVM
jgi:hypothetical protein